MGKCNIDIDEEEKRWLCANKYTCTESREKMVK